MRPKILLIDSEKRGQHYAVNDLQTHRIKRVLAELHISGHAAPDRSRKAYTFDDEEQEHEVHKRRWLNCPEHRDNDPSALVNESGLVYCFACSKVVGHAVVHGETATYRSVVSSKGKASGKAGRVRRTASGTARAQAADASPQGFSCTGTEAGKEGENQDPTSRVGGPRDHTRVWKGATSGIQLVNEENKGSVSRPPGLKPRGYMLGTFGEKKKRRTLSGCTDLLDILKWSNRQTGGPKTEERMLEMGMRYHMSIAGKPRDYLPNLFVGLHLFECTKYDWITTGNRTRDDNFDVWASVPVKLDPVAVGWVGVDLDGFTSAPVADADLEAVGPVMAAWAEAHPMFSGRVGVVRTSHFGVQLVLQLARERADGRTFYDDPAVKAVLDRLDSKALEAVRAAGFTGGHADKSVRGLGRLVRRPGPRVDKAGFVYNSRLVWATP